MERCEYCGAKIKISKKGSKYHPFLGEIELPYEDNMNTKEIKIEYIMNRIDNLCCICCSFGQPENYKEIKDKIKELIKENNNG